MDMELNFLGCGSAYYPHLGNTSAWFRHHDTFFLLDCGETVFRELRARALLDDIKQAVILITHFHADHCGSLPTLVSYLHSRCAAQVALFHPAQESMRAFLDLSGISHQSYTLLSTQEPTEICKVSVTPHRVSHADNMLCFGYVLSWGEDHFFFSGDASRIPPAVLKEFLNGNIKHLYIDCCRKPSRDHGELARHCADIPREMRSRVCCMHFSPEDMPFIQQAGFTLAQREEV